MSDSLVIASKIKKYVKDTYDLRTSQEALDALTTLVQEALAKGSQAASNDKRKTIAARDLV
jgi:histone H3/H4